MNMALLIPILALLIPIFGIVAGAMFKPWLEHQRRRLELDAQLTAEKAAQYAAHTDRLEQRVQVLERIITDRGVALSDEIERLRDRRGEPAPLN